jgi:hypothetical protein
MMPSDSSTRYGDPWSRLQPLSMVLMALFGVPAMTVMVFLRKEIGYRLIKPSLIAFVTFVLLAYAVGVNLVAYAFARASSVAPANSLAVFSVGAYQPQFAVGIFALLFLFLAIRHRRVGWAMAIVQDWHTMSRGASWIKDKVLPSTSELKIQRFIEPLVCFLLGLVMLFISLSLGLWLMFSGVALWVVEAIVYDIALNRMLDEHDARVEAKWSNEARKMEKEARESLTARDTGGVWIVNLAPGLDGSAGE